MDFDHCQSRLKEQSIDVKKIIERISKQRTFVSQVDALLTEYCLTDSQVMVVTFHFIKETTQTLFDKVIYYEPEKVIEIRSLASMASN